ncbi:MAG: PrsW family intramembrane metalloprotease [Lachnospiraceae bacterium]|nr:PrsW family intramembrane metalloprotease [Lachnospiraceae bacterium]
MYAENILICIAIPLFIALFFIKGGAKRFLFAFLIGMGVCLLSAYIGGFLESASGMTLEDTSVFISPVTEEIMKFLPVLLYLFLFEPGGEEFVMVALGTGAGFATLENCCYILTTGATELPYIMVRGMSVGVMHLMSMAVLSFGVNLLRKHEILSFAGIIGALSLSVSFHGLYNLMVSEPGVTAYIGYALPLACALALRLRIGMKK